MKHAHQHNGLRHTAIVLALLAAFGPVRAEDDIDQYTKPSSTVSVGLAGVSGERAERAVFGQYNGLRENDAYVLFDLDYVKRDDASGTWMVVKADNLGFDNRELSIVREKQGDWKYRAGYSELEKVALRTINTGMTGIGTETPTVARLATPGSGSNVDLKIRRKSIDLGYEKWLSKSLQVELSFKNEDKTGARQWGRGYDCGAAICGSSTTAAISQAAFVKSAILMMPEPIKSTTQQMEGRLNYHSDKLLVSAGYSGSLFNDSYGSIRPVVPNVFNNGLGKPFPGYPAVGNNIIAGGGASLADTLAMPMALAPDSQAHQMFVTGSYAITPKTRANFKYAYTRATQNDDFAGMGLDYAPAGVTNLGAKVVTTLAQAGLSARPFDAVSVLANVRYEKRDDKTPDALYNGLPKAVVPATTPASFTNAGGFWFNNKTNLERLSGKLEGSYRLFAGLRGTLGVDYNELERHVPHSITEDNVGGVGPLRAKNEEKAYRFELRRSLSEKLNGSLAYISSKRGGSDWTSLSTLAPSATISPANLALLNTYCGGVACYGQQMPADSILALSSGTPFPVSMTDNKRNKWKFSADWNPTDAISLQLVIEDGKDKNMAPYNATVGGRGWRSSDMALYSLDFGYLLSENWKISAYASHGDQTLFVNHSTYMADLNNLNESAALTIEGKVGSKLEIGGTLSYLNDRNKYAFATLNTTAPILAQLAIGLPDASFRQSGLNLYAKYALRKNADLRFDLVHNRVRFVEWTWGYNGVPFAYADNTTVTMQDTQNVTYLGISYVYKF